MAHWYVIGGMLACAFLGVLYYVWDLVRSYCDLKDRYDNQGRELTRLSHERFDLQGKLMQAEQENASALNQAEIWRHQETDLRGQLARLRDEAHKHKTDFIQANNAWDSQKSNLLAQLGEREQECDKLAVELEEVQKQYSTIRRGIANLYLEVGGNVELYKLMGEYKLMEQTEDSKT